MASLVYLRALTARALGWVCVCEDPSGQSKELFGSRRAGDVFCMDALDMQKQVGYRRIPHYEEGEAMLEVLNALGGQVILVCFPLPWETLFWAWNKDDLSWNACGTTVEQAVCKLLVGMTGLG